MRRHLVLGISIGALITLAVPAIAPGHGPCRCTTPKTGSPGTELVIDTRTLEVVFNPAPGELRIEPSPTIEGYHRPDAPSEILAENAEPVVAQRVTIPNVPPGRYLNVIYDGSEGGAHYPWDYVTVTSAEGRDENGDDPSVAVPLLAALAIALAVAVAIYLRRRPR